MSIINKIFNFFNIETEENESVENIPMIHKFQGVILDIRQNELIISSLTNNQLKMRVLIIENKFIPNMVYPSLYNKNHCSILLKDFSIRDRIEIEFDNKLREDTKIPINSDNKILNIINLEI